MSGQKRCQQSRWQDCPRYKSMTGDSETEKAFLEENPWDYEVGHVIHNARLLGKQLLSLIMSDFFTDMTSS